MSSALFDLTVLHDNDLIGIFNRAQSVSYYDYSLLPALDQLIESLLNLVLRFGIQG